MAEIDATLSLHMDYRHNDQHDDRILYVPYVNEEWSKNNYYPESNMTREQAFEFLFADAVREYNEQQSRPDRKIKNYLEKLLESEEQQNQLLREKRAAGFSHKQLAKLRKKKHCSVQMIVGIGNMQQNPEFMANGSKAEVVNQIIKEYIDGFQERNPNAFLYHSARHNDEEGIIHGHLSLVWFADGFKKGMKRQVSQKKALEAMGFVSDTKKGEDGKLHLAIEKWQQRERDILRALCKSRGINIIAGTESREYLDREHYILKKQKEESEILLQDANEKAGVALEAQEKVDAQLSNIKDFLENTENGEVYSIYAENRINREKISAYEKQNRETYLLLAKIWEQYKTENARYWEQYRADKEDLFLSLRGMRKGIQSYRKRVDDILYHLTDNSESLLGKLFSLIELLGICIENAVLKSKLAQAEKSYKDLKATARTVLAASKETSIALKSKDIDNVEIAIANWNDIIGKIDSDLQLQFEIAIKQNIDR